MRCSRAKKLFSPYIDKALTKAETELFDAHIRDCKKCRTMLEEMQAIHNTFSSMERLNAPYAFTTRVMATIDEKRTKRLSLFPVLSRLIEAAVVILVIIIGSRAGSLLGKTFAGQKTTIVSSLSLDAFESVQPNSIGGAYIAMMEGNNEK